MLLSLDTYSYQILEIQLELIKESNFQSYLTLADLCLKDPRVTSDCHCRSTGLVNMTNACFDEDHTDPAFSN